METIMIWLLTSSGLYSPDGTLVANTPFSKASLTAGDARAQNAAVIVDSHEIWTWQNREWTRRVRSDLALRCVAWTSDGRLLAGTEKARLAWVNDRSLEFIETFDRVEGRTDWNTPWGGPPDVRSLAVATDGTIYADIHVGWIVRSKDGGKSWTNLRQGLDKDVHMVAAHPRRPETVFCATARGFFISNSHGDTFERRSEPMPYHYQRACVCFPDKDVYLASTSRGPHGQADARLFRSADEGKNWQEVKGLPEGISRNIDTYQTITCPGGQAYVIVEDRELYETKDYGQNWAKVGHSFPELHTAIVLGK